MSNLDVRLPPIENEYSLYFEMKKKENEMKKKEKNLKIHIDKLPAELQRYIFDYIKIDLWFEAFKSSLQSYHSQTLNTCLIRPWLPYILSNPDFTNLCRKKIQFFETVWKEEKKNNKKHFVLMNKGDSFAQALLMYHYH